MDPQLEKPVLNDIKKKFENAASTEKSDKVASETDRVVKPKRIKIDNPEWLKASKADLSSSKIDDLQNIRRSASVSVSKKSFETAATCKSSDTAHVVQEKPRLATRGNPEWLKASDVTSQGNQLKELQNIKRSSSVSVSSNKRSFEAAKSTNNNDNIVGQKPKKTIRDNLDWLKATQPNPSTHKIENDDQIRERTSSVSVRNSKNSFEEKETKSESFLAWKQKRDLEKQAEDEKLSSLFEHLSPEEKKAEIEHIKMKKNVNAQIKVEAQYNDKVVATLELKKPGAETRTIKFTNVGTGIAGKFTSLSCAIPQFKTPEQLKAEQGGQESICWKEPEVACTDDPLSSSEKDNSSKTGEVDSESINFTNVKAGITASNLMLKTPEQLQAERVKKLQEESTSLVNDEATDSEEP